MREIEIEKERARKTDIVDRFNNGKNRYMVKAISNGELNESPVKADASGVLRTVGAEGAAWGEAQTEDSLIS